MGGFTPLTIEQILQPDKSDSKEPEKQTGGFTPLNINQIVQKIEDPIVKPVEDDKNYITDAAKNTAKFAGNQMLGTAELAMSVSSGALLWPFSKAWGVLNLPFGADAAKKAEESVQRLGYSPYTKEGKDAMHWVEKGFEIFLKPTKIAEEATKNVRMEYKGKSFSEEAAYLVSLGSELGQFAITGGAVKGAKKALTPKNKWDKQGKDPGLDSEFADAQKAEKIIEINKRRALQKTKGKPLAQLKRKEDILQMEREGFVSEAPRARKQAELDNTFKELKIEEVVGKDVPKKQFKDTVEQSKELPVETNLKPLKDAFENQDGISEKTAASNVAESSVKADKEFSQLHKKIQLFREDAAKKGIVAQADDIRVGNIERVLHDIDRGYISLEDATKLYQQAVDAKITIPERFKEFKRLTQPKSITNVSLFTDNMTKLRAGSVKKILSKETKVEGVKTTKGAFIEKFVADGYEINPGGIMRPVGELAGFKLNKTEADYGRFLIKEKNQNRTIKDTIQDVNTLIGKRGSIGDAALSFNQKVALKRLTGDIKVFQRNAKKVGKTVEEYLVDMKVDPKVAALLGRKSGELKKYAGSINLERQEIPREFKEFETQIQNPKKPQTWKETEKKSHNILSNPDKYAELVNKNKKGDAFNAAEIDAARQVNVNVISKLKEILETKPEKFQEHYEKYKAEVFDVLTDASSEAGRALNIHKKNVSVNQMATAFSKLKRNLNPRELKEFKELNTDNPMEVKRFMDRLGDPKTSDYFLEFWYNSILSGPPTHVVNAVGNTAWMTYQVPHSLMTALVDMPYAKLTGKQRTRFMNELIPMLLGYKTGFVRGRKIAGQILRHGKIQEFETKWAQEMSSSIGAFERSPNPLLRKAAPFITPPTRALRAMDAWVNAIGYDATVNSMARRISNQKGLKGKERQAFEKDFAEKLTPEQHVEAMTKAKHFTFMDDPDPFTAQIISMRNAPVTGTAMRVTILPFVNTISNLMKRGIELTPGVGLIKEGVSRRQGRGMPTPELIAKQIEGAVIAAYVWDKFNKGEITGSLPESKTERDSWYRQKKQPWAMKFGDTWYSYRRVEPFNTVIASAYVAYDAATKTDDQKRIDEIFFEIAQGMKNNVIDGSYFQGLQAVMNRHQKSKGAIARWGASWVPYSSFFRSMSRGYEVLTEGNAKAREGNEFQKAFSSVLPWLIDKPPAKLDVWGEEAIIPGGVFRQWLPFKWSEETNDPVEKELERLGYFPSVPNQTVKIKGEDVELDDDIYRKYVHSFGSKAKERLNKAISQKGYQRAAKLGNRDKEQLAMLRNYVRATKYAEIRRAIREQRKRN